MASNALVIEFAATVACKFSELESLDDGSLYIEVIDFGNVAICANVERSGLKESQKKVFRAEMWEADLAYSYHSDGENWIISVEGGMAAEIMEDSGLEGLEVSDVLIENVVLSWAEDGDSPKVVAQEIVLEEADISSIEIKDDFEEYP